MATAQVITNERQIHVPAMPNGRALRDVVGGDREHGELVDAIPPEMFGTGRARVLRKMVLIAIAKSADHDGTNAWPSRETIAHRCLVSVEAVRRTLKWLADRGLLLVESKSAPIRTGKLGRGRPNRYTILFPSGHRQMKVAHVDDEETPTTLEGTSATLEGTSANRSCYDNTLDSTNNREAPVSTGMCFMDEEEQDSDLEHPSSPHSLSQPQSLDQSSRARSHFFSPTKEIVSKENEVVQKVYDYYLQATGRNPRLNEFTPSRRKVGIARLNDCLRKTGNDLKSAEELMKSTIDAIARSDWHMGRHASNRQQYCDWSKHIFSSYEQMEKWWNYGEVN